MSERPERWQWPNRNLLWIDVAWALFAVANLFATILFPEWETVPFHFIWVSLTILYGFRVWTVKPTLLVLAAIMLLTGLTLVVDIRNGTQPLDEITEVPLMAAMFVAMVWHAQRRLSMQRHVEAVSQENLQLLERQRRFVQDASHELRTPITVALGHAELLERSLSDAQMLQDVQVVKEELLRLKRQADRLLGLIAYRQPDFLHRTLIEVEPLLVQLLNRWSPTPRRWKLGPMEEARILADSDRLALAVDALIENAVKHTQPDDSIELSARGEGEDVVIAVSDSGTGIADEAQERIFERFVQAPENGSRPNGLGLGLAIVKAVVEAHGGSVRVKSRPGIGTSFELLLARAG